MGPKMMLGVLAVVSLLGRRRSKPRLAVMVTAAGVVVVIVAKAVKVVKVVVAPVAVAVVGLSHLNSAVDFLFCIGSSAVLTYGDEGVWMHWRFFLVKGLSG